MATQEVFSNTLQYLQSKDQEMLYKAPRTTFPRPSSDTTEIMDTDFDSDSTEGYIDNSPRRSLRSFGTASVTTASTPDDVKTPDSTGLNAFHFHIDENEKPIAGPMGPHLFRLSKDSIDLRSSFEVDLVFQDTPISATTPLYTSASKLGPDRRDTPVPGHSLPLRKSKSQSTIGNQAKEASNANIASWTPQDVVAWMQNLSFDSELVEKFFINDISGAILLELQSEDLKELGVQSFGKRHQLMSSIRQLRNSVDIRPADVQIPVQSDPVSREATPHTTMADVGTSCPSSETDEEKSGRKSKEHSRRRHRRRPRELIVPEDSVSIVGIEQVMPKLHMCSKGEDCRKWQKQQAKLARLAKDLPVESFGGSVIVTGDPGNATTARNLVKSPKSEITPSLIASSDALGQNPSTDIPLSKEMLHGVQPRDPQENVRHFLNFQRLSRLQPANDPATPPRETFPSPEADSPGTLAENLRHLPKLRIPSTHASWRSSNLSPNLSAQRTVTPSIARNKPSFPNCIPDRVQNELSTAFSPADFYRQDPRYGQSTPLSEMDVPLTAIPVGPVERMLSQSVPPDMRFGNNQEDPIPRPTSTKVENHRRHNSSQPALTRLDEGQALRPIETPEDLERTPRAGPGRVHPFDRSGKPSSDISHSGWMKKRKTTRLLRHEWEEHHFALRGTQLSMYSDEEDTRRNSKALEHIDVDDYAVACSSLASSSKLTAAFKKTVLKRKDDTRGDTAFAFSLIPSPSNGSSGIDRKSLFTAGGKSHHFAVKTRDERIGWMREVMIARALKRGIDSGAAIKVNGNPI
ncbi:uncharacterized protein N7496_000826 [Penicillium cataractarum]|uniref:SAM and PH domain protein n=1 Tax=Penicillium cataractarum TaxID=2100454 RepID=A0A9W9VUZ1_9EURO|nr:uncharacterized protein N7496_000826 [Penicillium cataractarum]KAJ5389758.1 hypothetical protein N7496_000826 [Penicillium cataractarum]